MIRERDSRGPRDPGSQWSKSPAPGSSPSFAFDGLRRPGSTPCFVGVQRSQVRKISLADASSSERGRLVAERHVRRSIGGFRPGWPGSSANLTPTKRGSALRRRSRRVKRVEFRDVGAASARRTPARPDIPGLLKAALESSSFAALRQLPRSVRAFALPHSLRTPPWSSGLGHW